jgi:hypothetical protein
VIPVSYISEVTHGFVTIVHLFNHKLSGICMFYKVHIPATECETSTYYSYKSSILSSAPHQYKFHAF